MKKRSRGRTLRPRQIPRSHPGIMHLALAPATRRLPALIRAQQIYLHMMGRGLLMIMLCFKTTPLNHQQEAKKHHCDNWDFQDMIGAMNH